MARFNLTACAHGTVGICCECPDDKFPGAMQNEVVLLTRARDAAVAEAAREKARADAAEASAAAMRAWITYELANPHSATSIADGRHMSGFCRPCADQYGAGMAALAPSAGRALLAVAEAADGVVKAKAALNEQIRAHGLGMHHANLVAALTAADEKLATAVAQLRAERGTK